MARRSAIKSDSPVAAREQLNQRDAEADPTANLEEQAKEQEQQQAEELKAGKKVPQGAQDDLVQEGNVAGARRPSGSGAGAVAGFTDQLTRRFGAEAMEGHHVTIDRSVKGVEEGYAAAGLADNENAGNYGVYLEVGDRDPENGYPVTARVRLSDATFTNVTVPYEALKTVASRGI